MLTITNDTIIALDTEYKVDADDLVCVVIIKCDGPNNYRLFNNNIAIDCSATMFTASEVIKRVTSMNHILVKSV